MLKVCFVFRLTVRAIQRIQRFYTKLKAKSTTEKRLKRIVNKLYHRHRQTELLLNIYSDCLFKLQEYVKTFQGSETLIHKLHKKQFQVAKDFFVFFIKSKVLLNIRPRKLKTLDVCDPDNILPNHIIYAGSENRHHYRKSRCCCTSC